LLACGLNFFGTYFLTAVGICSLLFCTAIKIKTRCTKKVKEQMAGCFQKLLPKKWLWQAAFCFSVRFFPASVLHGKEKASCTNAPLSLFFIIIWQFATGGKTSK